jgi:hypothetical protein
MSLQRFATTCAASGEITNLVAGSKFEFMQRDSIVEVFCVADGTTLTETDLKMDVSFGNVLEADDVAVPLFTAGLGPNRSDHKLVSAGAAAGDRLQIKFKNADAVNAANIRCLVVITNV